ncbi:MAG: hypothetical protein KDC71_13610 [Acidobacteria bacterium]|nr:hypothetical protein [Acidobacteriota bacterium]
MRSIDWLNPTRIIKKDPFGGVCLKIPDLLMPFCWLLGLMLFLPSLRGPGLFLDGMTYAAVSRNLAMGLGTYWDPFYTATLYPHFFEAFPLGLILQSWFFQVFGDGFWVEKFYALVVFIGLTGAILVIWRQLVWAAGLPALQRYVWFPVLLLLLVPKVVWSFRNNLLENTVLFYDLLAVYCLIRALGCHIGLRQIGYGFSAALLTVGALMCKGPAGLFPLATAYILGVCGVFPFKRCFWLGSAIWIWFFGLVFGLMQLGFVANFANHFWAEHLAPAVWGNRADGHSFWTLAISLGKQLAPAVLLCLACVGLMAGQQPLKRGPFKLGLSLCLIGLSASLPLGISQTFRSFYLVPALPFFCLGLAMWTAARLAKSRSSITLPRWFVIALGTVLVFGLGFVGLDWGKPTRDAAYFQHSALLQSVSQSSGVLGGDSAFQTNWQVQALLARYYRISLQTQNAPTSQHPYILHDSASQIPPGYELSGQYFGPYPLLEKHKPSAP